MTDEQINIAIAEACGWTEVEPCTCCDKVSRGYEPTPGAHKKHLPDYANDLNAMHEVEEMLSEDERQNYWIELYEFAPRRVFFTHEHNWQMIHATARQRAEAFLRTIGKWEEVKP